MKKYMSVLFGVFSFVLLFTLLGFGANTVNAQSSGGGSGGGSGSSNSSLPAGCQTGFNFSPISGLPCTSSNLPAGCQPGFNFSSITGKPCSGVTPIYPDGCFSYSGFSSTTGLPCDGKEIVPTDDFFIVGAKNGSERFYQAGMKNVVIGEFYFTGPTSREVTIQGISFLDNVYSDGNYNSMVSKDFRNISLWDGTRNIAPAISEIVENSDNSTRGSFEYKNSSFTVPPGSIKNITLKADISATAQSGSHVLQLGGFSYPQSGLTSNWGYADTKDSTVNITGNTTQPPINANGETVAFAREFYVNNTATPIILSLAADNQYKISINGKSIASSVGDWNFNSVHTYNLNDITPLNNGRNKLNIEVFNNYATGASETGLGNPAGLIYKVTQGNNVLALSDGSETVSIDGGRAKVLSSQDPSWVKIDGAKWIWSKDFYGGTTTTQPSITLISNNISVAVDSNGQAVRANGYFSFEVNSPSRDIYIYRVNSQRYIEVFNNVTGRSNNPSPVVFTAAGNESGDTTDYYVIREGEARTFTLSFIIEPTNSGLYRANATSLDGLEKGTDIKFGSEFVTKYVSLIASTTTPTSPTATISVSPTSVTTDDSVKVTWSSTNATSCTGTGFSTFNQTSGSQTVRNIGNPGTVNYYVSCVNSAGVTAKSSATLIVTDPSTPTPTPIPVPVPTATFTISGQKSYTYTPGQINHYKWSSTNADTFSSNYTSTGPSVCGKGAWIANTASGESKTYISNTYAGCVWTVTYTAKNSQTGQSASDTVVVSVLAPTSRLNTGSLSANAIGATTSSSATNSAPEVGSFRFTKFLEEGSYGNEVVELQKVLNKAGYDVGNADGVFGAKVKSALMQFQTANGLKADGILGFEVRKFLNK